MLVRILIIGTLGISACAPTGSTGESGSRVSDRFMQSDTNGDGVISRAEAPSRLDFDAADTNADGVLTLAEIEAFTRGLR